MKLALVPVLLVVALLAMACQPVMPVAESGSAGLAGTRWLLTDLGGEAVPADVAVTAAFGEDGNLSGTSGCNNYSTQYEVDGQSITISPQMMSTMMMCPDPAMQVEQAYQQALLTATSFEITGDTLVLMDESGTAILTFSAQSQTLVGTSWNVTSYNNQKQAVVSLILGSEITVNFMDDGTVAGNAGCNEYFGSFETDGDTIAIGPLATTRKMCPGEGIMEQEALFLQALESSATYQVQGSTLGTRTADDAMAVNMMAAE
ncbi:MAG: META domain-containing protein [Caldilineaceae bacterium]